jgi:hypothetical protein
VQRSSSYEIIIISLFYIVAALVLVLLALDVWVILLQGYNHKDSSFSDIAGAIGSALAGLGTIILARYAFKAFNDWEQKESLRIEHERMVALKQAALVLKNSINDHLTIIASINFYYERCECELMLEITDCNNCIKLERAKKILGKAKESLQHSLDNQRLPLLNYCRINSDIEELERYFEYVQSIVDDISCFHKYGAAKNWDLSSISRDSEELKAFLKKLSPKDKRFEIPEIFTAHRFLITDEVDEKFLCVFELESNFEKANGSSDSKLLTDIFSDRKHRL